MSLRSQRIQKLVAHQDAQDRLKLESAFEAGCGKNATDITKMGTEEDHTPGPWIYYNAQARVNGSPVYTLTSLWRSPACVHDGTWIADVRAGHNDTAVEMYEGRANAKLLAAAPDLLHACKLLLRASVIRNGEEVSEAQRVAMAAIMKATMVSQLLDVKGEFPDSDPDPA